MDTTLLDAAFRLVSHSVQVFEASVKSPVTNEGKIAELKRKFPEVEAHAITDAVARALRLEATAIELAAKARYATSDSTQTTFDERTLSVKCPGFSEQSYLWAISDGFTLSRK